MSRSRADSKPENTAPAPGNPGESRVSGAARDGTFAHRESALVVENLVVEFAARAGRRGGGPAKLRVVDGVSLRVESGQSLGLVGESGCGKSTLARAVLRLIEPTSGRVLAFGQDVTALAPGAMRRLRRDMQIVFQDPGGSLDPRVRVGETVAEPLVVHRLAPSRAEALRRAGALLERCGLDPGARDRLPHEFSGGQRQRIAIARALATSPRLLVLDEPTASLDVSVQAQILNLLSDLQRELGLAYLLISHAMPVVGHMCAQIAVMRSGRIVEAGAREEVLHRPREEYTRRLLEAAPVPDPSARREARRVHLGTT